MTSTNEPSSRVLGAEMSRNPTSGMDGPSVGRGAGASGRAIGPYSKLDADGGAANGRSPFIRVRSIQSSASQRTEAIQSNDAPTVASTDSASAWSVAGNDSVNGKPVTHVNGRRGLKRHTRVKIAQLNAQHSKAASAFLQTKLGSYGPSMVGLIQEPWFFCGSI